MAIARQLSAALKALLVLTVAARGALPRRHPGRRAAVPGQANGSLLEVDGKVVGSSLLGQAAEGPQWFQARPSASDQSGDTSGGSNLGPTPSDLATAVPSGKRRCAQPTPTPRRRSPPTRSRHPAAVSTRTSRRSTPRTRRPASPRRAGCLSSRCRRWSPPHPAGRPGLHRAGPGQRDRAQRRSSRPRTPRGSQ